MAARLWIYGFHNVEATPFFPVAPGRGLAELGRQLRLLARLATVVPLAEGVRALTEGRPLPRRAVAITFDDGYRDNLALAVPLLERLGLHATFFLVPSFLDGGDRPWWERLAGVLAASEARSVEVDGVSTELTDQASRRALAERLATAWKRVDQAEREARIRRLAEDLGVPEDPGEPAMMTWEEAGTLLRRGFAVGSHSMSHPILSRENPGEQRRQLAESRQRLREGLGDPVSMLAYPNGGADDYTVDTVRSAAEAGYAFALTTRDGPNTPHTSRYELRRAVVPQGHGVRPLANHWR